MQTEQVRANDLLRVIRAEYLEMPGLQLTIRQAQRLWGLDAPTCAAMFDALVTARFLRRTHRDVYVLAGPTVK
jgi:hypothetical protein